MRFTLVVGQNGELMGHWIAVGYTMVYWWLHNGLLLVIQWTTIDHTMVHH